MSAPMPEPRKPSGWNIAESLTWKSLLLQFIIFYVAISTFGYIFNGAEVSVFEYVTEFKNILLPLGLSLILTSNLAWQWHKAEIKRRFSKD